MAASMKYRASLVFIAVLWGICSVKATDDRFDEELYIKALPSGHLYNHFQFTTTWNINQEDKTSFLHYRLFPKALGEVLAQYSVQELHLSLTGGLWRQEKWGYPMSSAPPGAELWVWFQQGTMNVDDAWTDLINVLSGMFCASLNFMDGTATTNPKYSFRPQGAATKMYPHKLNKLLRYAAMPRENVCTENLTPWKKLLPCGSKAGLGSLFNAIKLYDASYHSLGLHYRPVCQGGNCSHVGVELSQSLAVVFEPSVENSGKQDWSFRKLYGRGLGTSCPLAADSKILVDASKNKTLAYYFTLTPEPSEVVLFTRGGVKLKYIVYNIPDFVAGSKGLYLAAKYNKHVEYDVLQPPVLHAHRFQTGYGQDKGGLTCLLYNNHPTQKLTVVYMETIPWFLRTYFHTLKVINLPTDAGTNGTFLKPLHTNYVPGRDRQRPYFLELVLSLPPASVTKISVEFDRALLKWTEYPPDANHGFYINSAVISTVVPSPEDITAAPQISSRVTSVLNDQSKEFFLRIHTENLLVTLPTPDFSMPYNVICLACTVVAIAFGSIHNLTTRRFVVLDPTKKRGLLAKIKGIFSRKRKETENEPSHDDKSSGRSEPDADNLIETKKDK